MLIRGQTGSKVGLGLGLPGSLGEGWNLRRDWIGWLVHPAQ